MKIQFLGTGAGSPSNFRNVSSLALKHHSEIWLFDCGEGTQQQILKTNIKPSRINRIFISHLHGDHIFGLPGLVSSRSFLGGENLPLTIYGPPGLRQFLETALAISDSFLSYPLEFVELTGGGELFRDDHFTVRYGPLEHRIACFGFRLEERAKAGRLDSAALAALGVPPGPLMKALKAGETIEFNGQSINGRDYLGSPQPGKVIAICGDSRPSAGVRALAENADWLVFEATVLDKQRALAQQFYHSTVAQSCALARAAGVKNLVLNHISARYGSDEPLQAEAEAHFPGTVIARDLLELEL